MAMPIAGNPLMRFEGEIDLVPYNSRQGITDFSKPTTGTDRSLEDVLDSEAAANDSFKGAWDAANLNINLPNLVRKYKTLKKNEIKLIMAYTYPFQEFYRELNEDFRNHALTGGRFSNAKRILRNALIELAKVQETNGEKLPVVLYRWEPSFLAKKYREQKDKSMHLNMFTSTSLEKDRSNFNPLNDMLTEFRNSGLHKRFFLYPA